MRTLVTGAAGFIGSHLCDALLSDGHEVVGLDAFISYYPRSIKEYNISHLRHEPRFTFYERDLRSDDLTDVLDGVEVVFHIAAMPGLLASWTQFDMYVSCNINATQRLLEAVKANGKIQQFIHASTSSVYGKYVVGPESMIRQPISPYGITKLAGEHLVQTYETQFNIPTSILRYYSVYGPRQRPDMGYQIFIDNILNGKPITLFGDGTQRRGNTYVGDVVEATVLASKHFRRDTAYNIGGVEEISANEVVALIEEITGKKALITYGPERLGEQSRTLADISAAQRDLCFYPSTTLREGLTAQIEWHKEQLRQSLTYFDTFDEDTEHHRR
ncbi:MAG: NAD-dependent epimerase/dehydratase family protein [Anaerolineae bacterium]